jgi:ribosomal subunit interface protein
MNIQHFEKGLHYSADELLSLARKLGKLATFCKKVKNEDSFIRVEAERRPTQKRRDEVKAAVMVSLPRATFRAESRRPQVVEAVDRCIEKLEAQLKRYKEEQTGRGRAHKASRRRED